MVAVPAGSRFVQCDRPSWTAYQFGVQPLASKELDWFDFITGTILV